VSGWYTFTRLSLAFRPKSFVGKTAEAEVDEVSASAFVRGREALQGWADLHRSLFPDDDPDLFPEAEEFGLHRVAGGGLIQGDTCNQANKLKALMQEKIAEAVAAIDPLWSTYDDETKAAKVRTHQGDCWNHLRNIWFGAGAKALAATVKEGLLDDLSNFSGYERVSSEIMDLVRAVFKEFHQEGDYAKGKGCKEYRAWLHKTHPTAFYVRESRAAGGRQDLDFEGCVAIYINRPYYLQFLFELMRDPTHSNILEDFLYVVLISSDMLAAIRTYALLYVTFITELRYLAGCSHKLKNWSPFSMARVANKFEGWMEEGSANGQAILDLCASGDSPFAAIESEQPEFAAYREHEATKKFKSPDKTVSYESRSKLRAALAKPTDTSNQTTTSRTVGLIEVFCGRVLVDLRDPSKRTHRYLDSQDGELSWAKEATQAAHKDTEGCFATNDILAESVFGAFDQVLRESGTIGIAAASGIVTARRNGDFERGGSRTLKRKRHTQCSESTAIDCLKCHK